MSSSEPVAGASTRFRPPHRQLTQIDRERLSARLDEGCANDGVVVVSAPAGYGKTVAVAAWAAQQATPVAWLRLTSFDTDRSRVIQGIVRALQAAAQESVADLSEVLALAPLRNSAEEVARQLLFALEALETPVTLVIDDAHRAAEGTGFAVIEALIASRPDTLRLMLVGTSRLGIALAGSCGAATISAAPWRCWRGWGTTGSCLMCASPVSRPAPSCIADAAR